MWLARPVSEHGASENWGHVAGDGGKGKLLCSWPLCHMFASTEIKIGVHDDWHPLCKRHRRTFLEDTRQKINWQPRRREKQTRETDKV